MMSVEYVTPANDGRGRVGFMPDRSGLKVCQDNFDCSSMERPIKKLTFLEHIMNSHGHSASHSLYLPFAC